VLPTAHCSDAIERVGLLLSKEVWILSPKIIRLIAGLFFAAAVVNGALILFGVAHLSTWVIFPLIVIGGALTILSRRGES
jgi:hypothetical protein